ncbi:glycoside hydrolase family 16 protein [Kitasatospora cineracea]|uniref:Glycosyl hydrolase family 16 n=1 Tax=Kitasatospora cineracea TaxID=88074 RepID=A0A3N4RS19_9ACTN|nr:glycoside hydrolase family 16 protein [Kitasatospora cineracea]RPE36173.1 glycosyl hydrolase family 16 [Kitasatospora cineracea]
MAALSGTRTHPVPAGRRVPLLRSVLARAVTAAAALLPAHASQAADTPPNPLAKPGYTLDFDEEFDGSTLDPAKWLDSYLPHWTSTPANAKARYTIADGALTERLDAHTSSASANSEIDMIETFFSKPDNWRIAAYGWGDPNFLGSWWSSDTAVPSGSPTTEYHVYGMDRTPTQLNFYYDNQLHKTINDAPDSPMGMILGLYTDAGSGVHNDTWPKTWNVDYVRVYKNSAGYSEGYQRIKNHQTGQYFNTENKTGNVQYGNVPAGHWSSQWAKETTADGYTRYRNRWTGAYMNATTADPLVHYGDLPATDTGSQWTEEAVGGYKRLKNRSTGTYAHTENLTGNLQHGAAPSTWWTSQWTFEPAS